MTDDLAWADARLVLPLLVLLLFALRLARPALRAARRLRCAWTDPPRSPTANSDDY